MRWDVVQQSMLDELEKIGEISLSGLSPQSVLEKGQPAPPMETPGLSKAMAVLTRYQQATAGMPKMAASPPNKPVTTITTTDHGKKKRVHIVVADPAKSLGAHTIGGAAAGKFLAELAQKNRISTERLRKAGKVGAGIGAGIGVAEFARKRIAASKTKKAAVAGVASPRMALRAAQEVGKPKIGFHKGSPHLSTIGAGSTLGRRFQVPM